MKSHLDAELKSLTKKLVKMGEMVQNQIKAAIRALLEQDSALAKKVIKGDEKINSLEIKIENFCLELLALYQPAAIDLRFVTMTLRINNDLEKMADLAVNIAERSIDIKEVNINEVNLKKPLQKIAKITDISNQMVENAVNSFVNKDTKLAEKVCKTDDKVDKLHEEIFADLIGVVIKSPASLANIVGLIFINKYIERIADHADNIGEDVVFIARGKSIRHQ
ncbi:MAG: phosphate signaling complex protein PhoU [Actinobacteria bacterium]|nr:MAG: phosphate signaling complex protein PhoU [Actinomycetota bacterium]